MKIALIADELTTACLKERWHVMELTPWNYRWILRYGKPDLLLVESAWKGLRNRWKYKIANYPDHPKRSNATLKKVVELAQDHGIPTAFWNKEDGVHFERFIDSAKLFEYIFTVDENCIPRYQKETAGQSKVSVLPFAVERNLHYFLGFSFKTRSANFVGSYSRHIHQQRREWQQIMFKACQETGMPLHIYDRNSARKSSNYRYPSSQGLIINSAVPYPATADIYRSHLVSLNVNTVENSPTMYSRRLVEILACGGIAVTNPSPAVQRYFSEFCHVVHDESECREVLGRLFRHGPSRRDLDRALGGAEHVQKYHSWEERVKWIMQCISIK